jgi:hypothetical protein
MAGHNEPDGFGEALSVSYYNAAITACRQVNPAVQFFGPQTTSLLWTDFATQVQNRLAGFAWDMFPTGNNPGATDNTWAGVAESSGNFASASSAVQDTNVAAFLIGGYAISSDNAPGDASYPGAYLCAKWCIDAVNNSRLPVYMCRWEEVATNDFAGFLDIVDNSGNINPSGWFMAQAVRKVFGTRWHVTGPANFFTLATRPSAGKATLLVVNYGGGTQNNKTVAFSHWPFNGNGNGSATVWQFGTQSQTYTTSDPATVSAVGFTNGVSVPMNFPDPSITIISI